MKVKIKKWDFMAAVSDQVFGGDIEVNAEPVHDCHEDGKMNLVNPCVICGKEIARCEEMKYAALSWGDEKSLLVLTSNHLLSTGTESRIFGSYRLTRRQVLKARHEITKILSKMQEEEN